MSGALFLNFIVSLATCTALIPVLIAMSRQFAILDLPGGRKLHDEPVVRIGGLAFAMGASASILIWLPKDPTVLSCLLGSLVVLGFGVWDDRVGLGYKQKLLGQFLAASVVVSYGDIRIESLPLLSDSPLPLWVSMSLTYLVLVGAMNAINLADGLDGLAGGLSLISLSGMACLAFRSNDALVMVVSISVLGGLLGFLRFNTYPARIFMGDGGSQFLGFYLGVVAILLSDPVRSPYDPGLLLLILGLPVLDTLSVMVHRLAEGRSPFRADRNHIHHKLLSLGWSHPGAVTLIYTIQMAMVSLAYVLRNQSESLVLLIYACIASFIMMLYFLAWRRSLRQVYANGEVHQRPSSFWEQSAKSLGEELPLRLVGIGVALFLCLSVFLPQEVPPEFRYPTAGLLVLLMVGLSSFPDTAPFLVRLGLYVGSAFVVYLSENALSSEAWLNHGALNIFYGLMAVLIVSTITLGRGGRFQPTPLDYLIVLMVVIVMWLPEVRVGDAQLGQLASKLVILFFAFELLLSHTARDFARLRLISYWLLLGLGIRAWW